MQNTVCANPEKEISHLLANNEITDHHKLLPDSSYLDMLHILFHASVFRANISLWEILSAVTSLQFQPQPGWGRIVKQKPAEGNSITFTICDNRDWRRVFRSHSLKEWHVHRAEKGLCSSFFLFVASLDHSVVI